MTETTLDRRGGYDWRRRIDMSSFNHAYMRGLTGWDLDPDGGEVMVWCAFKGGGGEYGSRNLAVAWDDISTGMFFYRDFTSSSIPVVDEGEIYISLFTFQLISDAKKFVEKFHRHTQYGAARRAIISYESARKHQHDKFDVGYPFVPIIPFDHVDKDGNPWWEPWWERADRNG